MSKDVGHQGIAGANRSWGRSRLRGDRANVECHRAEGNRNDGKKPSSQD
jgi:hypothetical protein